MKFNTFLRSASVLVCGVVSFATAVLAQGPLYDKVTVDLPYSVTIGDKVLQPGNYVIRQQQSKAQSRTLLIYGDNGSKYETSVQANLALMNNTPKDTKVILHHYGNDYYFDRIWLQGKDYGYEFPVPSSVKARQRELMQPITLAARYEAVQPPQQAAAPPPPPPPPAAAPAPPPPAPAPPPAVAQAPAPPPQQMPVTSANWVMMLLSGGTLSGLGLALRRKRWQGSKTR